jgi:hypothetical protein
LSVGKRCKKKRWSLVSKSVCSVDLVAILDQSKSHAFRIREEQALMLPGKVDYQCATD